MSASSRSAPASADSVSAWAAARSAARARRAASSTTRAHHAGDDHEQRQRERLVAARDVERVRRFDEEEVDQQRGDDGGRDGGDDPADHRHGDHGREVEQHLAFEREGVVEGLDRQREQRQAERRRHQSGDLPVPRQRPRVATARRGRLVEEIARLHDLDSRADRRHGLVLFGSSHGTLVTVTDGS